MADRSIRLGREREAGLIAIAWSGRVLDQPNAICKDIPRHRSGGVLVARVLVVDTKRNPRGDRHIGKRDLVAVWGDRLQRDSLEVPPARMYVSRSHAVDARERRRREIGSARGRTHEHDANSRGAGAAGAGTSNVGVVAATQRQGGDDGDRKKSWPHAISIARSAYRRPRFLVACS